MFKLFDTIWWGFNLYLKRLKIIFYRMMSDVLWFHLFYDKALPSGREMENRQVHVSRLYLLAWRSYCGVRPFFFTQHGFVLLLKLACITGVLWAKRGERGILHEAPNECEARDVKGLLPVHCSGSSHVHYMNVAFQLVNWLRVVLACLFGTK